MNNLQSILLEYKNRHNLTNEEIAKKIGTDKSTIGRWLSGTVQRVHDEQAIKLSELLGYDISPIIKGQLPTFKKPILGIAKAGYDLFLDENYLGEESVTYDDFRKGDYFLRVTGDSMNGVGILNDSLVYVHSTEYLQNGDIGVFQCGEEVTIKKIIRKENMIILEAANPLIENRYFTPEDVASLPLRILGKVLFCKIDY